jgi:hypothetical protein
MSEEMAESNQQLVQFAYASDPNVGPDRSELRVG